MSKYSKDEWLNKNKNVTNDNLKDLIVYGENLLRQAMLQKDISTLEILIADKLKFQIPTGEIIRKNDDISSYKNPDRKIVKLDFIKQTFGTISLEKVTTTTETTIEMIILNCNINENITFKRVWSPIDGKYQIISGRSLFTGKQR